MYATTTHTKRFPTLCRFFQQGHCRAGNDCHFSHPLPLTDGPGYVPPTHHAICAGNDEWLDDSQRRLHLQQLDTALASHIRVNLTHTDYTRIELDMPFGPLTLTVPHDYPWAPCLFDLPENTESIPDWKAEMALYQRSHPAPTLVDQVNHLAQLLPPSPHA
ncbi:hypothetical protein BC940DRAFT_305118 [Gongronella butleri]|nr:hypothetical protein BC940DRAFT_305118 [Gongronella butleri]